MLNPALIQIGNRIVNINAIRWINVESPQAVDVYIYEEELPLQFAGSEASALMTALGA